MSKEATHPWTCERRVHRRLWRSPLILWAVFAMGLIVQAFAPRLKIENGAFVIPVVLTSSSPPASPAELVARERTLQTLSAALTLAGAVGLAYYYRDLIKRRF
jgi:hypothetical protein